LATRRSFSFPFRPRLWASLHGYRRDDFIADLGAGITVALVALPLAMAFGIASGVRPDQGIATAIVGGLIVSLLGGSRVQIAGPAGAFVGLLYAIADKYGVANLLIATMMAGVLLFAMGAFRLGTLVRFVPVSIVIGFTTGIAAIIALSQVRDFLGLAIERMPSNFFSQLAVLAGAIHTVNWTAVQSTAEGVWTDPAGQTLAQRLWEIVTANLPFGGGFVMLMCFALAAGILMLRTPAVIGSPAGPRAAA